MKSGVRRLRIVHDTCYTYDRPVQRSMHRLHLHPLDDWRQNIRSYHLRLDPPVPFVEYEDVFGNWTTRFEINQPYTQLRIHAESEVDVQDIDPFAFADLPIRPPSYPVAWMPWERTMLAPYLTPEELPDTQLTEIYDYAMGFVERNNRDLMQTLFAINMELYRNYEYVPGSTTLETTPFEVFTRRKGVCQDFATLFICMARLLGIPARYVCGYVFTGNNGLDRAQSDASHAWVQLYIPNIGWKGFDPTNGVLPHQDHVRVGYGRHWRDVTPTSGTIYSPANETMTYSVVVQDITPEP